MAEPYLGEIRLFPFGYAPRGWQQCNGQVLQIQQYQALFVVIGNAYGGDGRTTFALPNLCGRVPLHANANFPRGRAGGEETHALTSSEMPRHTHVVQGTNSPASDPAAPNNSWATTSTNLYASSADTQLNAAAFASAGNSDPHPNMQPYLVANYCIAMLGIFPSAT